MHTFPRSHRARLAVESLEDRRLLSTISGYVFSDVNDNGLYGAGDSPIAGSNLQLKNASGQIIATAVSDMNGFYQFTTDGTINTAPATRTVIATFASAKTGWTQTAQVAQFDPSLGTLTSIDFINTETMQTEFQLENLDNEPGTINSSVTGSVALSIPGGNGALTAQTTLNDAFNAQAFDGTIDFKGSSGHDSGIETQTGSQMTSSTDPNLLGQFEGTGTVTLSAHATSRSSVNGPGNLLAFLTTSEGAQVQIVYHYLPSNALKPGNYTIVQPSTPAGYLPGLKSSNGVVIPNSVNTNSIKVTLNGNSSTNNDFAEVQPSSLSGHVYVDLNKSGKRTSSDPPLSGVTITLTGSNDLGTITPFVVHTDSTGTYQFNNLRPGNYTISETQPANYSQGTNSIGTINGVVTGTKSKDQFFVGLGQAESGIDYDYGELLPASPPQVKPPTTTTTTTVSKYMLLGSTYRLLL